MANKRMSSDHTQIDLKVVIGDHLQLPKDIILLEGKMNSQIKNDFTVWYCIWKFFVMIKKLLERREVNVFYAKPLNYKIYMNKWHWT